MTTDKPEGNPIIDRIMTLVGAMRSKHSDHPDQRVIKELVDLVDTEVTAAELLYQEAANIVMIANVEEMSDSVPTDEEVLKQRDTLVASAITYGHMYLKIDSLVAEMKSSIEELFIAAEVSANSDIAELVALEVVLSSHLESAAEMAREVEVERLNDLFKAPPFKFNSDKEG